ncbi:MAG: hypothetical protein FWG38_10225 [Defluviitaleaceae bacterium]|nr:hypothetical protein [Defluviitaleaceae bacterium]
MTYLLRYIREYKLHAPYLTRLLKRLTAAGLAGKIRLDEQPRDENGQFAETDAAGENPMNETGENAQTENVQAENAETESVEVTAVLSATGANPNLPGFTEKALADHWGGKSDHSSEYPNTTKAQYAQRAHDLVRTGTGATVLGYKASDGSIVRYDTTSDDFAKGYESGIATMFKLVGGEPRFNKIMTREGGVQND